MADMQYASNPDLNDFLGFRAQIGAPSPTQLGDAAGAVEKAKAAAGNAAAGHIKAGIAKRDILTNEMTGGPRAPKLQTNLPDAPQENYRSPTEAFSSLGPVLAVFGSLLTRRPMTTAMNAAAAAMRGFHAGDKEVVEREREKWADNMEKALKQNQTEIEQYRLAQEQHQGDMAALQAKMQAIAADNQDWHTMASLQTPGGVAAVYQNLKVREEAADKISSEFSNYLKARKANVNQQVTLTDAAIDRFADAVHSGVKPSTLGLGWSNNANKTAVMNRVAEKYPDFDMAAADLAYGGMAQEKRTVGAAAGRIKLAANSLDRAVPLAKDAAKKVDLSQYPSVNALENAVRRGTGDPNIIALNTALQTVISDYAALMVRSGVPTVESRNAAREMVNSNMAQGQLDAFFDQIEKEKGAQLKAIDDTRGKKGDDNVIHWDDLKD